MINRQFKLSVNWSVHHLIIHRSVNLSSVSKFNQLKISVNQSVHQLIINQYVSLSTVSQPVSLSVNQSLGQSVDVLPVNWSTNKNISNQVSPSVNDTAGQIIEVSKLVTEQKQQVSWSVSQSVSQPYIHSHLVIRVSQYTSHQIMGSLLIIYPASQYSACYRLKVCEPALDSVSQS